jgi:hypothetical protein
MVNLGPAFQKAEEPSIFKFLGNFDIEIYIFTPLSPAKAYCPISSTVSGKTKDVNATC